MKALSDPRPAHLSSEIMNPGQKQRVSKQILRWFALCPCTAMMTEPSCCWSELSERAGYYSCCCCCPVPLPSLLPTGEGGENGEVWWQIISCLSVYCLCCWCERGRIYFLTEHRRTGSSNRPDSSMGASQTESGSSSSTVRQTGEGSNMKVTSVEVLITIVKFCQSGKKNTDLARYQRWKDYHVFEIVKKLSESDHWMHSYNWLTFGRQSHSKWLPELIKLDKHQSSYVKWTVFI